MTIARNATDVDDAVSGGELALRLALRVVPLAVAAGVLVTCVAASRRGRRAAMVAVIWSYLVVGVWVWSRSMNSPRAREEDPVSYALEPIATFVTVGTAFALAAAVVAWWFEGNAVGRDSAERVLALETTSRRGSRDREGAAMRAELASVDDPVQQGRFARSAAVVAFRHGLVAAAIAGTLMGRSFRAGLETAVLAWFAVCTVAVEVPQALAWYHNEGILLLLRRSRRRGSRCTRRRLPAHHSQRVYLCVRLAAWSSRC